MRSANVAAVALVGVADDVLLVGRRIVDGLPLDAGREARAAATAQAGLGDDVDDTGAAERQCLLESDVAAVRAIGVERQGIDDAAAGERQSRLAGEEIDLFDRPDAISDAPSSAAE